jgi:hypothetical protein
LVDNTTLHYFVNNVIHCPPSMYEVRRSGPGLHPMKNDTLLWMRTWSTHQRIPQSSGCPTERRKTKVCDSKGRCNSDQTTSAGSVSTVDCSREETVFQRSGQGWYGHTDFLSRKQVLTRCSVRYDLGQEYSHLSRLKGACDPLTRDTPRIGVKGQIGP